MPKAYSMDLRERVAADHDAGLGTKAVAEKYSVSPAWVRRLIQQRRERGDLAPRSGGHYPRRFSRERLAELVAEQPDATLAELREALGVTVSLSALHKALAELKLTFKKKRSTPRSRTGRTSPSVARVGVLNN